MTLLLLSLSVPLVLSFYPPLGMYKEGGIKALFLSLGIVALTFGAWDVFATWRGHWHFDPAGVWAVRMINLPVEEVLFFVVIPFCCIFTWETLKYFERMLKK
jgi:lycopene cyclase domain-containing protein